MSRAMDENRINGLVERSSVNGRENIAESFDVLQIRDWGSRVADNEPGHKADLRESVRQESKYAEERFATKRPLYGQQTATSSSRARNRRRSDGQSLLNGLLAPQFTNTRRKSTSELERTPDDSMSYSRPNVPQTASVSEGSMCNEMSASSTKNEQSIFDSDSAVETLMFPAMSRVNIREQSQLSSSGRTHRKESKGNRLKSGESVTVDLDGERLARSPTHKISLPAPVQGNISWMKASDLELTRNRSFSDSEVEDSMRMSVEQREKLKRLKYQILENNSNRKNTRKVSGLSRENRLPVLTEKSLKRYARCHEMANGGAINADQKISTVSYVNSTKVNPADSESEVQNPDLDVGTAGKIARHTSVTEKCDTSFNTDKSRGEFIAPLPSTLAYSEIKRKPNGSDFPTAPTSEEGDFESISVIIDRLRARSEPGDVGSRKVSSVQQLQTRTRSETDDLKTKVESFVKKPLPALPPSTLRVKKQSLNEVSSKAGHFKAGANANATPERRERKEGAINIHTCPNMNLLSDRSWMYQDESRKRHRYIRGPATPIPPVDFVFRKDNPDLS